MICMCNYFMFKNEILYFFICMLYKIINEMYMYYVNCRGRDGVL